MNRTDWFTQARFGMFIHWGIYAIPGQGEWYRSQKRVPEEDYRQYFDMFDPSRYDPRAWAKAAREAGMRYAVLTAKHHDGFCLFDSKLTDYKSTRTKARRDLVRDFLEAARAEGLRAGLYYSLLDWHHPDYPKYGDRWHPMRDNPEYADEKTDFSRYLGYMHGQVEELCANYGKIDIMWFDFSYDDMTGEKWRATDLIRMIRKYQPEALIDNRLEASGDGAGSMIEADPPEYRGDFASPEHFLPEKGLVDRAGRPIPWELCTTMNNNWGYVPADRAYKPASLLIHKLAECVSKGGNMILNVGPDPLGRIPEEALATLARIGRWMRDNGESIHSCGEAGLPRPDWGRYTRRDNIVYAHLFEEPIGPIPLTGIRPDRVKSVTLLRDGSEARDAGNAIGVRKITDTKFVTLGGDPNHTYALPCPCDTVLRIELRESDE